MLCTDREEFSGTVSGGCVETDVCRVAALVREDRTARLIHYGPVGDTILETGLNCEGEIEVLVEPVDREWLARAREPFVGVVTVQCRVLSEGDARSGSVVTADVKRTWYPREMPYGGGLVRDAWDTGESRSTATASGILLAEPVLPAPTLVIFGAGPLADDLARIGKILGFTTVIGDPRETRFPPGRSPADRTIVGWPDETLDAVLNEEIPPVPARIYIVSLEHEPRFEDALWEALLERMDRDVLPARPAYIGAIGKAQRAIERDERAREARRDLSPLTPIRTPIGLDIGGKSTGEIALSIAAQIVATLHNRGGGHHGTPRPSDRF